MSVATETRAALERRGFLVWDEADFGVTVEPADAVTDEIVDLLRTYCRALRREAHDAACRCSDLAEHFEQMGSRDRWRELHSNETATAATGLRQYARERLDRHTLRTSSPTHAVETVRPEPVATPQRTRPAILAPTKRRSVATDSRTFARDASTANANGQPGLPWGALAGDFLDDPPHIPTAREIVDAFASVGSPIRLGGDGRLYIRGEPPLELLAAYLLLHDEVRAQLLGRAVREPVGLQVTRTT